MCSARSLCQGLDMFRIEVLADGVRLEVPRWPQALAEHEDGSWRPALEVDLQDEWRTLEANVSCGYTSVWSSW